MPWWIRKPAGACGCGVDLADAQDLSVVDQYQQWEIPVVHFVPVARCREILLTGAIRQPTLIVNGSHDILVPTINSYILQQHIPGAQLIIYPDSGHGALFQYPELLVRHVSRFLASEPAFT